jgi:holliday junction DNA helicase RuvA
MIGRLTGTVACEESDGTIVLDVGGVGYELSIPLGTIGRAKALASGADGSAICLHVHTHVREDVICLYAFATPEDKAAFRVLISVSNVGPKTALAVLSALPAHELARTLAAKDVAKLLSVPGIGRKTAERLVLELKDRLMPVPSGVGTAPGKPAAPGEPSKEEILARALTGLGYRAVEADRAIQQLRGRLETDALPNLIREALALLAR